MIMEELKIENVLNAPEIHFDPDANTLSIKGESYPENAREFYKPVMSWINTYLEQIDKQAVTLDIELKYFNSSSAKILMNLFDALEQAAGRGKNITINWRYHKKNLNALEYGEDFKEDLECVKFYLLPNG
jgi:hypothetical protein